MNSHQNIQINFYWFVLMNLSIALFCESIKASAIYVFLSFELSDSNFRVHITLKQNKERFTINTTT